MRYAAIILSALFCVAFVAPGIAAPPNPPSLRYSIELPPGEDGTPPMPGTPSSASSAVRTAAADDSATAAPPLRYSVEADGPRAAPQTPVTSDTLPPPPPSPPAKPVKATVASPSPSPATASVASQGAPQEHVTVKSDTAYRLGPGDKVHITVYGEADLTGDYEISGNGRIAFPLIGDVRAGGMTAPALGVALTQKLSNGYLLNPRVAVEITTYRPFFIVGQVNKPGQYPYVNGMTAMNAIALAGGFTPRAAETYVYVRHEGQTAETRMRADAAMQIRPGDVVRVDESGFWSVVGVLQPIAGIFSAARYGIP